MNSLGIYFGIKDINLVEINRNKISNNIRLPHPKMEVFESLEEKVPQDLKIIGLLKGAFRDNHINANEVTFCISGQDLVIRTFEIPRLPKSELKGAVSFEAKKYIPFKLEDLDFDFQVLFNKQNKTSLVLFVGIKKETLTSYLSFAKQLNLKINALEYSAFSVLRFLKLAGLSDAGVMACICFDARNEDEANFTVFENGFSLFSRDFGFAKKPVGFEQPEVSDQLLQQDGLKNEIRISFDYYNRKFPDKAVKNVFVVSDKESFQGLKTFFAEGAISAKLVDTQKVLGRPAGYSSILVKSFAAAKFKSAPLKIKINLIGTRVNAARVSAVTPLALLENIRVDFKYIFLGAVICIAVFAHGLIRRQASEQELEAIRKQRVKISSTLTSDDLAEFSAVSSKYREEIAALDKLVKNQLYATPLLSSVPPAMPEGVWLESFNLNQINASTLELTLNGAVYLTDDNQEFESVNIFLENLKKDPIFSRNFKEILISSLDRKQEQDKNIVVFKITCKNFPENKRG